MEGNLRDLLLNLPVEEEEESNSKTEAIYDDTASTLYDDTASTLCDDRGSTLYSGGDDDTSTLVDSGSIISSGDGRRVTKKLFYSEQRLHVEVTGCSSRIIKGKEIVCCILSIQFRSQQEKNKTPPQQQWKIEKSYMDLLKFDSNLEKKKVSLIPPNKNLFSSNAPIKVDQRKIELELYFRNVMIFLRRPNDYSVSCYNMEFFNTDIVISSSPSLKFVQNYKQGYLTCKEGKLFSNNWKTVYCILVDSALKVYETKRGVLLNSIKLSSAMIGSQRALNDDTKTDYRHALIVKDNTIRHMFCAYSDQERDNWVTALSKSADKLAAPE